MRAISRVYTLPYHIANDDQQVGIMRT